MLPLNVDNSSLSPNDFFIWEAGNFNILLQIKLHLKKEKIQTFMPDKDIKVLKIQRKKSWKDWTVLYIPTPFLKIQNTKPLLINLNEMLKADLNSIKLFQKIKSFPWNYI